MEIILIFPIAFAYMIWLAVFGQITLANSSLSDSVLLMCAGPATAIPLILYANCAKRLRLSTIGMMQYIAPTIIFLLGIFVFGETLDQAQLTAFILIWIALALYSWSIFQPAVRQKKTTSLPEGGQVQD